MKHFNGSIETGTKILIIQNNSFFAQQHVATLWLAHALKLLRKPPGSSCFWSSCFVHFKSYPNKQLFKWIEKLNIFRVFIFMNVGSCFQNLHFSEYTKRKLILQVYISNSAWLTYTTSTVFFIYKQLNTS